MAEDKSSDSFNRFFILFLSSAIDSLSLSSDSSEGTKAVIKEFSSSRFWHLEISALVSFEKLKSFKMFLIQSLSLRDSEKKRVFP